MGGLGWGSVYVACKPLPIQSSIGTRGGGGGDIDAAVEKGRREGDGREEKGGGEKEGEGRGREGRLTRTPYFTSYVSCDVNPFHDGASSVIFEKSEALVWRYGSGYGGSRLRMVESLGCWVGFV